MPAIACNDEILTVSRWLPAETGGALGSMMTGVAIEVRNNSEKVMAMVDGDAVFTDILGQEIAVFKIDPDTLRTPGSEIVQPGLSASMAARRLDEIDHERVVVSTCVRGVVYEDGTVERF